jgi:hypothetical protein
MRSDFWQELENLAMVVYEDQLGQQRMSPEAARREVLSCVEGALDAVDEDARS